MNPGLAPPQIMFAALKALHCAAYTTRNLSLDENANRQQVYDLWEAIHEVPDLLTRWRGADSEKELLRYLGEYTEKWKNPDLLERYHAFLTTTPEKLDQELQQMISHLKQDKPSSSDG